MVVDTEKMRKGVMTKLWLKHSMLGFIISRLELQWKDDPNVPAPAYTDGKKIVINTGYIEKDPSFSKMKLDHYIFLVAHEVLHILDFTTARRGTRNPELWNIAADYVINASLIHNRKADGSANPIGEMPCDPDRQSPDNPAGLLGLYDIKYRDMSIEQVYDLLLQENKDKNNNGGSDSDNDQETNEIGISLSNSKNGQQVLDIQLDQNNPKSNVDKTMSAEIKAIIQTALDELSMSKSGVDSAYSRGITELLKPPAFDWKGALRRYLTSLVVNDTSWRRFNRKSWGCGVLLPSTDNEIMARIGIAIDTSGSISHEQIKVFLSHIAKIMASFKKFEIDIWCFSTEVHLNTVKTYTKSSVNNLINHPIFSKGGTDIESNFQYLTQTRKPYNVFICMTDGMDSIENLQFNGCPVVWAIVDNPEFVKPMGVKKSTVIPIKF